MSGFAPTPRTSGCSGPVRIALERQMSLPIVLLSAADAGAIEAHLLRLNADDRSTRFTAGVVPDAAIARYVAGIAFDRDHLIGALDEEGRLVAFAHGCVYAVPGRSEVEVAFSVDVACRKLGLATALMAALRVAAERSGVDAVVAMCLARNAAMRRVLAGAGMRVELEDGEVHARWVAGRPAEALAA
jgi:RimJ/RimL family protein N-acetyltransferase